MARLLLLINQDRAAAGNPAVCWIPSFETTAVSGTVVCPQVGRALSGMSEYTTRICGYAGNALPSTFADSMISFWKSYNAWWTGAVVRRVACGFKQGTVCTGACSSSANWKPLSCIYASGTAQAEEEFSMVSWDHPMLYGHAEMDVSSIDFNAVHGSGRSTLAYIGVAAVGLVAAAAAVVLAMVVRRRRLESAPAPEYVEMIEDQLA